MASVGEQGGQTQQLVLGDGLLDQRKQLPLLSPELASVSPDVELLHALGTRLEQHNESPNPDMVDQNLRNDRSIGIGEGGEGW